MKILQLCNRVPFPPTDGGSIAMHSLSQSLIKSGADVKVFAMNTSRHRVNLDSLPHDYKSKTKIEAINIDTRVKALPALFNLFSTESYNVSRFDQRQVHEKLQSVLTEKKFDIVQFESIFCAPYLKTVRQNSSAKCVLRAHNVEYQIWERMALRSSSLKKLYLKLLASRLKKYEQEIISGFDALLPMTKQDERVFSLQAPDVLQKIVPIGLSADAYPYNENQNEELCLFHLGAMDWLPNREAIEWFLENCWIDVKEKLPLIKLYLAGRGFPEELKIEDRRIIYDDEIKNAVEYMQGKSIMIVPLLSGSGMRVKILQAFALGKAVVSTTIGAEGIECTPGENILIADSPSDFVSAIDKLVSDESLRKKIGKNSRRLFLDKYSSEKIAEEVIHFYQALLK
jgi:glycosyltransferase involved in cell wall biosynthesis